MSSRIGSFPNDFEEELCFLEQSCSAVFEITRKTIVEQLNEDPDPRCRGLLSDFASIKQDVQNLRQAAILTNKELREGEVDFCTITEDAIDKICNDYRKRVTQNLVEENREIQLIRDVDKFIASKNQTNDAPATESQELFSLDDSDVIMTENVETFTDPISKVTIQNPFKNKYCGHYFEKSVILEYVANQYKKCPYIGCDKYMSAKDLIEDTELKVKIANSQAK